MLPVHDDGHELLEFLLGVDLVFVRLRGMDLRLMDEVGVEFRLRLPEEFDEELAGRAFALPVLRRGEHFSIKRLQHRVGDAIDLEVEEELGPVFLEGILVSVVGGRLQPFLHEKIEIFEVFVCDGDGLRRLRAHQRGGKDRFVILRLLAVF